MWRTCLDFFSVFLSRIVGPGFCWFKDVVTEWPSRWPRLVKSKELQVMLRNLPNNYTRQMLSGLLSKSRSEVWMFFHKNVSGI